VLDDACDTMTDNDQCLTIVNSGQTTIETIDGSNCWDSGVRGKYCVVMRNVTEWKMC